MAMTWDDEEHNSQSFMKTWTHMRLVSHTHEMFLLKFFCLRFFIRLKINMLISRIPRHVYLFVRVEIFHQLSQKHVHRSVLSHLASHKPTLYAQWRKLYYILTKAIFPSVVLKTDDNNYHCYYNNK